MTSVRVRLAALAALALLAVAPLPARAQSDRPTAVIKGDAAAPGKPLSDRQYGIFFEDINHGADGGLYPEQVQNRSFEFNRTDSEAYDGLTAWSSEAAAARPARSRSRAPARSTTGTSTTCA